MSGVSTHKEAGNDAFRQGNYSDAIDHFTAGINENPENHVLYSNRSACHANLKNWKAALEDAQACVRHQPDGWAKGYSRLGAAHYGLGELNEALDAYRKSLAIEPTNEAIREQVAELEKSINPKSAENMANPFASLFGPHTFAKIQTNPRLSPFLAQQDYVNKINMLISNPSLCQGMMSDQRIMQTMLELMGVNAAAAPKEEPPRSSEAPRAKPEAPKAPPAPKDPSVLAKEAGNAHYKKREFEEALRCYDESISLDSANGSAYLNRTSVLFEQGKMEECEAELNALLDKYENKVIKTPDFVLLSKILTRKGEIHQRQGKYSSAIEFFQSALRENRNADTLKKLNACEKEKKETEAAAYIDPELSLEAKNRGNELFKLNEYPEAVQEYTEAIKRNPKEHTCYSNRAAAYMKLAAYDDAVKDCEACLSIEPTFLKAMIRLGHCYFWRKEYHKAIQEYEKVLKIDPSNQECSEGIYRTRSKIMEGMNAGEADQERVSRAQSDPEIQGILGDTYMQFVLREMQMNPGRANEYMADPNIASKIQKLAQAGIISFGPPK